MPFLGSGLLGSGLGVSGGSRLIGATWAVDGNGRAYNTPTVGAELLTDGGVENWSSATDLTSWVETTSGTSTVNRESLVVHGGTFAARFDVDALDSSVLIAQSGIITAGVFQIVEMWMRASANGKAISFDYTDPLITLTLTTNYEKYTITGRNVGGNFNIKRRGGGLSASSSLYLDDLSVKALSMPTLLAYVQGTATDTPLARINTIATGTQAGVIGWCDDPSNPQNFVIGIRNGAGSVNLTKCVAGTYTNLISSSVAFVADAAIEIRRPSGNTFQLWYNGSQVGANQTINDSAIADNGAPFFGPFSTYSGNTFTSFSLNGVDIPFPGA